VHSLASVAQGHIWVTAVQLPGDPSKASTEGERFHFLAAGDSGVYKSQERSRVWFHRAADVEDEDEAAQALSWCPEVTFDRFASGLDRRPNRAANVRAARRALRWSES
jgi:hypothetical protein